MVQRALMARVLLIIDIQRDYFPGGAYPARRARGRGGQRRRSARRVSRRAANAVIHMQHLWRPKPDAPFMRAGTARASRSTSWSPRLDGELVLQKAQPNSFLGTELEAELRRRDPDELVVAGMMSSMCVDATVRAAVRQGVLGDRRARRLRGAGAVLRWTPARRPRRARRVHGGAGRRLRAAAPHRRARPERTRTSPAEDHISTRAGSSPAPVSLCAPAAKHTRSAAPQRALVPRACAGSRTRRAPAPTPPRTRSG